MASTGEEIPVGAEGVDGGESGAACAPESEAAQLGLFGDAAPDGAAKPREPVQSIYVHFEDLADVRLFAERMKQPITTQTKYLVFPPPVVR